MLTEHKFLEQNFWWLEPLGFRIEGSVQLARSEWISADDPLEFHREEHETPLSQIFDFAQRHGLTDVHRSLCVRDSVSDNCVWGPLLSDIDLEHTDGQNGSQPQFDDSDHPTVHALEEAAGVAADVVRELQADGQAPRLIRTFFSGHKGFHVETVFPGRIAHMHSRPTLDTFGDDQFWKSYLRRLRDKLVPEDSGTTIDKAERSLCRGFTRLRGTINRYGPQGHRSRYIVTELAIDNIRHLNVMDLLESAFVQPEPYHDSPNGGNLADQ